MGTVAHARIDVQLVGEFQAVVDVPLRRYVSSALFVPDAAADAR
jgi:hypothetical protein